MKGFEDPYKSEGSVQVKVGKLSEFAQGKPNARRLNHNAIYLRGLPWRVYICAMPRDHDDDEHDDAMQQAKILGYFLQCDSDNADATWSCKCSATMKILAQKEDIEDDVYKFEHVFTATENRGGYGEIMSFKDLMDPESGFYDVATDSIIIYAHLAADAPHGVKNMPDDLYKKYSMRSEHSLFVEMKEIICSGECSNLGKTSNLWIEDKLWELNYSSGKKVLNLEMSMHQSDDSKTTAECIFWYWNYKKIAILQKIVHTFGDVTEICADDSEMKTSKLSVPTNGISTSNKKFNVVIRLLDERLMCVDNGSLESYYGDYAGVDTVTLCIVGTNEASFVVPKHDLFRSSPVFQRMFANEMTEKATGKVEIEDTNPEEFGDFLKAISPKQEHPNPLNVFALLKLADRYECQLLRERCEFHLMNCVEIPLLRLLTCANFYELNKLKKNLLMSFDRTALYKLHRQTKPYLSILIELTKMTK